MDQPQAATTKWMKGGDGGVGESEYMIEVSKSHLVLNHSERLFPEDTFAKYTLYS